jgi:hypothetical protein
LQLLSEGGHRLALLLLEGNLRFLGRLLLPMEASQPYPLLFQSGS